MTARVRRPGPITVIGVTTHHDVIWHITPNQPHATKADTVHDAKSIVARSSDGLVNLYGEHVNETDIDALIDALKARNQGHGFPLCASCHMHDVVLGLDVCTTCTFKDGN